MDRVLTELGYKRFKSKRKPEKIRMTVVPLEHLFTSPLYILSLTMVATTVH